MTHTFCVCAYKESPFLEECILSLINQTVKSNILIATSTPNGYISSVAEKYGIPLFVNDAKPGIGSDWNFAISKAETDLITVAHQDDVYEPEYLEMILAKMRDDVIIAFSDYAELRDGKKVFSNKLLRVKRAMLFPLRFFRKSIFVRRRVLSFGCPICCPSVTYNGALIRENPFKCDFKSNLDWQQWENLSRIKGSFIYIPEPLMCHRIHEDSETSKIIGDNLRTNEDYIMFCKFWPEKFARRISKIYASSEKSNES